MFVHKNTRAQFAQHAAQIRDSSTEEEEEEGDLLQVIIIKINITKLWILLEKISIIDCIILAMKQKLLCNHLVSNSFAKRWIRIRLINNLFILIFDFSCRWSDPIGKILDFEVMLNKIYDNSEKVINCIAWMIVQLKIFWNVKK